MRFLRAFALSSVILCATSLFAQDTQCLRRTLPFNLIHLKKTPLNSLRPPDLLAELHGKPVKILAVSPGIQPHRVVIVLDASGSMRGGMSNSLWPAAVDIAEQFVAATRTNLSLALYIFGVKSGEHLDFSAGNDRILDRLQHIHADKNYAKEHMEGYSPIRDALLQAEGMLGAPEIGDTILLLSDGGENSSRSKEKLLPQSFLAGGIRFFFCLLDQYDSGYTPEELGEDLDFRRLALETGGFVIVPFQGSNKFESSDFVAGRPSDQAMEAIRLLDIEIIGYDLLDIELPSPIAKPEDLKLSLIKEKSRELKDSQLLYPHRLLPCSQLATSYNNPSASK